MKSQISNHKSHIIYLVIGVWLLGCAPGAQAITTASDTLSTSRPSADAVLSTVAAAGDTQLVVTDNGSLYIANDTITLGTEVATVASYSSADTPEAGVRTIYLKQPLSTTHALGTTVSYDSKAMHTISFTPAVDIPSGGKIIFTFPGGFGFNGLAATDIQSTAPCTFGVSSPTVTCTTTSLIAQNTSHTIIVGCLAASSGICQTPKETLTNPSKVKSDGIADTWSVGIKTQNASGSDLESKTVKVATDEVVTVKASVPEILSLSNTGLNAGSLVNNGNAGCQSTETITADAFSTATAVNLGRLALTPTTTNTQIANISAQLMNVTTNVKTGYVLTATSSGHLTNTANGYQIADNVSPIEFPVGTSFYGIHACGADAPISTWNTGSDTNCHSYTTGSGGNVCKYANPDSATPLTLASSTHGPVGPEVATGSGTLSILYGAGVDENTSPGVYFTKLFYMITTAF